jgi:eukaryotic-like serine/threonine-protein kinase
MATIVGQTFLNQFRVDSFVASGGMGAVYRVWDIKRNVPLAMKVLHADLANDPVVFKRFHREANALKKLAHPNIVPFYGLYQTLDIAFLLERFVDGPSLGELLRQRQGRPLALEEALVYLKALCAALGYAHSNGVIHCDVKPGNVMIDRSGTIYLTDFGIARHAESTLTTMGGAGTPAYMAPEQIRAKRVTPATDIYALGVLLFEMLTGKRPFRGDEAGTEKGGLTANERIRYGQLNLTPPDPRSLNPGISTGLSEVILKALSKRPEDRFDSTQALYAAVCSQAGITPATVSDLTMVPVAPAPADYTTGQVVVPGSELPEPGKRKWPIWATIGIAVMACMVLAAVAGGVYAAAKRNHPAFDIPTAALSNNQAPVAKDSIETATPEPTATITPTPTETVPPATPTLGVGSTWTRPKDGMVMVFVPAGDFQMGTNEAGFNNAQPKHVVSMDAFWIDSTDVTNTMFKMFIGETGYKTDAEKKTFGQIFQPDKSIPQVRNATWLQPRGPGTNVGGMDHPVVQVSWNDANKYCKWAGDSVSLPTEAQWEKAARGTDGNKYPWTGASFGPTTLNFADQSLYDWVVAWNRAGDPGVPWGGSGNDGFIFTSPAGYYPAGASPYKALDMAGNVMQWVADFYGDGFAGGLDNPEGPASGLQHVLKGGWWSKTETGNYTFIRNGKASNYTSDFIGFRCAATQIP